MADWRRVCAGPVSIADSGERSLRARLLTQTDRAGGEFICAKLLNYIIFNLVQILHNPIKSVGFIGFDF
jgi:hypothetical protein